VPELSLDYQGIGAFSDQQGDACMPEGVWAHPAEISSSHRRFPVAPPKVAVVEDVATSRGENELALGRRRKLVREEIHNELGDRECASAARSLQLLALAPTAADSPQGSDDAQTPRGQVEIRSFQPCKFAPTETEVGTCIDEWRKARIGGCSEAFDLLRGQKAWLGSRHAGENDGVAR
jgi:hypothetical protein